VLDPAYLPTTSAEYELFQEKLKYVYGHLESKVETAKGKAIIRKHESKYDAQKAYAELHESHLKSTKASLSAVKILGYITSAKIGDVAWHSSAENFNSIGKIKFAYLRDSLLPQALYQINKSLPCYRLLFILFKNFIRSRLLPHCSRSIPRRP
jgi:hypothetical protein